VLFYEGTNFLGSGRCGITWNNVPAGQYVLRAVAIDDLGLTANSADVAVTALTGPPPNDAFANRIPLSGATVSAVGHNVGATTEPGEPHAGWYLAKHSIWYSWVAPSNGLVAVSTDASPSGMMATIHTGSAFPNLVRVGFALSGTAVFLAQSGTTYQVAVDSGSAPPGTTVLGIRPAHPPLNDNFTNRITISGLPVTVLGCNIDSIEEPGEPIHGYGDGGSSVWWSWTAPESGTITASSTATGWRTSTAVYTGTNLTDLVFVAGKGWGDVSFKAAAGTTYQIAIDGERRGDITLNIRRANPPTNDDFAHRISLSGGAVVGYSSNVDGTREPGEPSIAGHSGFSSVWWSWTAPFDDCFVVTADGTGSGLVGVYTGNTLSYLNKIADQAGARLTFHAIAGTTYQIAVDREADLMGLIRLGVFPQTPRFESVSRLPSGGLQLSLAAEPARAYPLQASSDLRSWLPIMTNWSFTGSTLFSNADVARFQRRFYRAASP
jgi:hypothetical protein